MEPNDIKKFSDDDLKSFTNNFHNDNFIGQFQFGRVFRGKIKSHPVTVKIFEDPQIYKIYKGDNEQRLEDEILLLTHRTVNHPNLVKLIGTCAENEHLCVVYDLNSLNTVRNLVCEDDFTWLRRIKVALRFACLLEYMQNESPSDLPFLLRNLDAAHIMLDQDYNPKLYDFSMITGGIFPDRRYPPICYLCGSYGYIDTNFITQGVFSEKTDVFAFGVILLNMITKRVHTEEERLSYAPFVYEWAQSEYKPQKTTFGFGRSKFSIVHQSLQVEQGYYSRDGSELTKLAMQCVEDYRWNRPTMRQIVKRLLNLRVVCRHAEFFGISQMLPRLEYIKWKYNPMHQIKKII